MNVDGEHIVLNYGADPTPVAWLARDGDGFVVQFNVDHGPKARRQAVELELDMVLDGAGNGDAWREAIRRCGLDANGDPPVHWGYFPTEPPLDDNGGD